AFESARPDTQRGSEENRARSDANHSEGQMDQVFAPNHLARAARVPGTQAEMRGMQYGVALLCKRQNGLNFGGPRVRRMVVQNELRSSQLERRPFGASGRGVSRTPLASKMALSIAGATAMMGVSPAPAEGISLRSSKIASISGTSRNRGTRY